MEPKKASFLIETEKSLAGIFFAVLVISIFLQVFVRLFATYAGVIISLPWTEEIARFCFIWMLMLGAAVGMANQEHFALTVILKPLPEVVRGIIEIFVFLAELLFAGILLIFGYEKAIMEINQFAPALGISYAFVYAAIPVGSLLMIIHITTLMLKKYIFPATNNTRITFLSGLVFGGLIFALGYQKLIQLKTTPTTVTKLLGLTFPNSLLYSVTIGVGILVILVTAGFTLKNLTPAKNPTVQERGV